MGENLKIKRLEIDEFKHVTAIEFGDDSFAYDVVEFCKKHDIVRFPVSYDAVEKTTKMSETVLGGDVVR